MAPKITVTHTKFQYQVKHLHIELTHSELERSNKNHAGEGEIGHPKKRFCQNMVPKKSPERLLDCGLVYQAGILSRFACGEIGRTGVEEVTRQSPYIS